MHRQCRRHDHRGRLERHPDVGHRNLERRRLQHRHRRSPGEDRRSLDVVHQYRPDVDRPDEERQHPLDEVRLGGLRHLGDPYPG
ncbi:MAG: hypothetical protein RLZ88_666 [Actinomycetota bacterium]